MPPLQKKCVCVKMLRVKVGKAKPTLQRWAAALRSCPLSCLQPRWPLALSQRQPPAELLRLHSSALVLVLSDKDDWGRLNCSTWWEEVAPPAALKFPRIFKIILPLWEGEKKNKVNNEWTSFFFFWLYFLLLYFFFINIISLLIARYFFCNIANVLNVGLI